MEMHELPISLWVNNCTQKKNGILYRVEEKFEIENMIKIPYINSFNMDNLFVSAILR